MAASTHTEGATTMPDTNTAALLAEMLAKTAAQPTGLEQAAYDARERQTNADWARNNPSYCTGRGPTGRLRNFRAMNPVKLADTYAMILAEGNDPEARTAIEAERAARGL